MCSEFEICEGKSVLRLVKSLQDPDEKKVMLEAASNMTQYGGGGKVLVSDEAFVLVQNRPFPLDFAERVSASQAGHGLSFLRGCASVTGSRILTIRRKKPLTSALVPAASMA